MFWRDFMKKKLVYLIVLVLACTSLLNIGGPDVQKVTAAPSFQKVNFTDAVVTANSLNVRQGPSTKYPVVCVLKKGQKVKVFGKIDNWYAVYDVSSGCVGAVSAQYIKTSGSTTAKTPTTKTPTTKTPTTKTPTTQTPAPQTPTTQTPQTSDKTPSTTPPEGISQDEQKLLDLVNEARADAGVGPLAFDMELVKVARLKAQDMVNNNYFAHQSPTYGSPFDMMRKFDIEFKTAGENIAGNQTVEAAFKAWMNSEGHRKNILNGSFNYTGIGIVDSPTYGKVLVQQFIGK